MSVRLRLTLTYAAVLVGCAALLLLASYGLVARSIDAPAAAPPPGPVRVSYDPAGTLATGEQVSARIQADTLADLRSSYALALLAMAMGAVALGWLLAGRALRPLHAIAATARGVDRDSLASRRVRLAGPADELKELGDAVDGMLTRLDAAFAREQRFVANASHELRTPLAVIRAEVDVALADPGASAGDLRATAERVRAATDRSERLIESLLTLARSEADAAAARSTTSGRAADLGLDGVRGELRAAGLAVRRDLATGLVRGDRRLLERLVANLIENAVRHNHPGGWIAVTTGTEGGAARLRVENSGPVVSPERVHQLLEPFGQGSPRARSSGAGLGLSIVRSVAEAHGGRVEVDARPDGGLAVGVTLPARLADP